MRQLSDSQYCMCEEMKVDFKFLLLSLCLVDFFGFWCAYLKVATIFMWPLHHGFLHITWLFLLSVLHDLQNFKMEIEFLKLWWMWRMILCISSMYDATKTSCTPHLTVSSEGSPCLPLHQKGTPLSLTNHIYHLFGNLKP